MLQGSEKPLFYFDPNQFKFSSTMFYGIEWQLIVWNTLVFAVIDMSVNSFAIAGGIAWVLNYVVVRLRARMGEANLSRKALVNDVFLL